MKAILSLSDGCELKIVEADGIGYMVIIYPTTDKIIIPLDDLETMMTAYLDHVSPGEGESIH